MAAVAMLPAGAVAESGQKSGIAWPLPAELRNTQTFNEDWRFHRGDATGAEVAGFNDSAWRRLDVPHDWSIEDRTDATGAGAGSEWSTSTSPTTRVGPFDIYASEGQGATGWTVGGVGLSNAARRSISRS